MAHAGAIGEIRIASLASSPFRAVEAQAERLFAEVRDRGVADDARAASGSLGLRPGGALGAGGNGGSDGKETTDAWQEDGRVAGSDARTPDNSVAPARIFGGFSFSPDHRATGIWAAFPRARFLLPAVEIEFDPQRQHSWLIARADSRQGAEELAARWVEKLNSAGRVASDGAVTEDSGGSAVSLGLDGIGRATWSRMVSDTLQRIGAGEADKVVLARTLDVTLAEPVGPVALATTMWRENQGSHVFLFEPVPGHALVGAAPEKVAALSHGLFRATAVAGSVAVGTDSVESAQLGRRLFASTKDRAEHDFVVKDMVARLEALGCKVRRDVEPHVLTLARIQHLETKIAAELPPDLSLLAVLGSLHPTPAVCGFPRAVALEILTRAEVFERGWYAGPVGWFDSQGNGIFVPALRSALWSEGRWRTFAGAGIVPGSDPELEWEETEIKFHPVLRALARASVGERLLAGTR